MKTKLCKVTPRTPEEVASDYVEWLLWHPEATAYIYDAPPTTKAGKCARLVCKGIAELSNLATTLPLNY